MPCQLAGDFETLSISHCRPEVDPAAAANATDQRSQVRRPSQNDGYTQHASYPYPSEALGSIFPRLATLALDPVVIRPSHMARA